MPDSVQDQRSAKSASTGSSKAQDDSRGSRISSRNSSQGYGTSRDSVFTASSPDGTTSTSNFSRGGNRKSARLTNRETYANGKCVMPEAPSTTPYEKKPCSDDEEDSQAKCGSKEKTKKSARRRRKKQDEAAKVSKIVQNKLEMHLNYEQRETRFEPLGYHRTTARMHKYDVALKLEQAKQKKQKSTNSNDKESCTLITPRLVMNSRRVVTEHYADKLTDYANKVMETVPINKLSVIHRYRPHSSAIERSTENGHVQNYSSHVGAALHAEKYVQFYQKEGLDGGNPARSARPVRLPKIGSDSGPQRSKSSVRSSRKSSRDSVQSQGSYAEQKRTNEEKENNENLTKERKLSPCKDEDDSHTHADDGGQSHSTYSPGEKDDEDSTTKYDEMNGNVPSPDDIDNDDSAHDRPPTPWSDHSQTKRISETPSSDRDNLAWSPSGRYTSHSEVSECSKDGRSSSNGREGMTPSNDSKQSSRSWVKDITESDGKKSADSDDTAVDANESKSNENGDIDTADTMESDITNNTDITSDEVNGSDKQEDQVPSSGDERRLSVTSEKDNKMDAVPLSSNDHSMDTHEEEKVLSSRGSPTSCQGEKPAHVEDQQNDDMNAGIETPSSAHNINMGSDGSDKKEESPLSEQYKDSQGSDDEMDMRREFQEESEEKSSKGSHHDEVTDTRSPVQEEDAGALEDSKEVVEMDGVENQEGDEMNTQMKTPSPSQVIDMDALSNHGNKSPSPQQDEDLGGHDEMESELKSQAPTNDQEQTKDEDLQKSIDDKARGAQSPAQERNESAMQNKMDEDLNDAGHEKDDEMNTRINIPSPTQDVGKDTARDGVKSPSPERDDSKSCDDTQETFQAPESSDLHCNEENVHEGGNSDITPAQSPLQEKDAGTIQDEVHEADKHDLEKSHSPIQNNDNGAPEEPYLEPEMNTLRNSPSPVHHDLREDEEVHEKIEEAACSQESLHQNERHNGTGDSMKNDDENSDEKPSPTTQEDDPESEAKGSDEVEKESLSAGSNGVASPVSKSPEVAKAKTPTPENDFTGTDIEENHIKSPQIERGSRQSLLLLANGGDLSTEIIPPETNEKEKKTEEGSIAPPDRLSCENVSATPEDDAMKSWSEDERRSKVSDDHTSSDDKELIREDGKMNGKEVDSVSVHTYVSVEYAVSKSDRPKGDLGRDDATRD